MILLSSFYGEHIVIRNKQSRDIVFNNTYEECFPVDSAASIHVELNNTADVVFRLPNGTTAVFNDTRVVNTGFTEPGYVCLYIYGGGVYESRLSMYLEEEVYVSRYSFLGFIGAVAAVAGALLVLYSYWGGHEEYVDTLKCGNGTCKCTGFNKHECILSGVSPREVIMYFEEKGFRHHGEDSLHVFSGKLTDKIKQIIMRVEEDSVKLIFIYRGLSSSGLLDLREVCRLVAEISSVGERREKELD